jgi:hypothetical protein
MALWMGVAVAGSLTSGCAVSESDVHRWETTENGPDKLYAIVTHDKYAMSLRDEAALSLVRMKSRNGRRVGLEYLVLGYDTQFGKVQGGLSTIPEDARRHMLADVTPKLVAAMAQLPPKAPEGKPGEAAVTDMSVPYKDAAFAILSHDPPLVVDDKVKSDLTLGLVQWVQTDFADRVGNTSQQFGVEQIMRYLGAPSVKQLPSEITLDSAQLEKAAQLVADIGDDETKKRASEALVAMAKQIDSQAWLDKKRTAIMENNAANHLNPKPDELKKQIEEYQEAKLEQVFITMKKVGGRPVVDYCLGFAKSKDKSEKMRSDALAASENRIDKNNPNDLNTLFDIVRDDTEKSDKVRGLALARMGELPKDMILPKLYSLFNNKWQVRLEAGKLILKTMTTKDLPDFMHHLPENAKTKIARDEVISYATLIMAMEKPRDALNTFLQSPSLGAKLTAVSSYYSAKKADAGPLMALQEDKTPLPKCDTSDGCNWQVDTPKPGTKDVDTKTLATVGDYVKSFLEPSLK